MDRFQEMKVFTAVVDAGSFVGAAGELDLSKAAVSRLVAELEGRLGVRLLHRTTRRLSLTVEGQTFYTRCKSVLADVDEAEAEITAKSGKATGLLKINVPVTFGLLQLAPLWPQFMRKNPEVTLDITLNDRVVDLVEEGYDMAVRIARLPSSSLISRQLASTRLVLCASPQYLKKHGRPKHPDELAQHCTMSYSLVSLGEQWEFDGPEGKASVRITPQLKSNSGDTCRAAALGHAGIILQPDFMIGADLAAGTLVELLPEYRGPTLGIHAVYPSRRHVAPKVRLLVDYLVQAFKAPTWRV